MGVCGQVISKVGFNIDNYYNKKLKNHFLFYPMLLARQYRSIGFFYKTMEKKALRYNNNKPQWSLIDFKSLLPLIDVLEYGAHKYSIFINDFDEEIRGSEISKDNVYKLHLKSSGKENWKLGLDKKEILESLMRHLISLMDGEEYDNESKLHHIGHVMANAMFYSYYLNNGQK